MLIIVCDINYVQIYERNFGWIHLCGDDAAMFLTLLTETESCFETSACFIPAIRP